MIRAGRAYAGLQKFFFAPTRPEGMAILRVAIGFSLFCHYATTYGSRPAAFGPASVLATPAGHTAYTGLIRPPMQYLTPLAHALNSEAFNSVAYLVLLICAAAFAVGFRTRRSGWILFLSHTFFFALNEYMFWGWGDMARPFLLYALCAGCTTRYSIDDWLRPKTDRAGQRHAFGPAWPTRLLQVHVSTMYLVVAWTRLDDPNWRDGSMLYGILCDPLFARFQMDYQAFKPVLRFLNYASWITELCAPFLLWIGPYRRPMVLALWALHAGLEALTFVGYWNVLMIAALFCFWFDSPKPARPRL